MVPDAAPYIASLGWVALAVTLLAGGGAAGLWWLRHGRTWRARRQEREIQQDVAEGRYHRAVPYLLEHGRVAEAARLEALRGNPDEAARLYERAGDVRGAASVYLTMGDHEMAALVLKEGGLLGEAADAFSRAGRHAAAAALYEQADRTEAAMHAWREAGDPKRAAQLLERLGRGGEAQRMLAQAAEDEGRWEEAGELWEALGERHRAVSAWLEAGQPRRAGEILMATGDVQAAASLLVKAGDFRGAAEAFARIGEKTRAAHAFYRAGDLSQAVRYLTESEEWVTLGRLLFQHGEEARAMQVLGQVSPDAPRYEEARMLLADAYVRTSRPKEAFRLYDELVRRRVARQEVDADVRRWVVTMAEILFRHDKRPQALQTLRRLEGLALMTPELSRKIAQLEAQTASQGELADFTSALGFPQHERYDFVAKLGEGGNGVIYRAVDKMLGRELAIKMIGQTALPSDIAKQFFLREAQTAARLNHPNIVTIYDMGEIDGRSYIAMELIDGESLADILTRAPATVMEPADIVPIVDKLCAALEYAHERGVIHRDVKLENVMVTRHGEVKLMDFGLAKAIHGSPDKSLVITGTPLYMSPEQIAGADVDGRTDIYSLGVMLYRCLTGQWPYFEGSILEAHREAPIPDPTRVNPRLPAGFRGIVLRTMAKQPDRRYAKATEVSRAMREVFGEARA